MSTSNGTFPRVVMVGAGSIGGATAAVLACKGVAVEIVTKHQSLAEKIRTTGIAVRGRFGRFSAVMPAVAEVGELSGPVDVVFLATKAQDMLDPVRRLRPLLSDHSAVVSLQNGITLDALGELVDRERLIGCVVGWGASTDGKGSITVTSKGSFVVGRPNGGSDPLLRRTQELLSLVLPTRITSNIYGALYSKLMINLCINSVGALTGLGTGAMLRQREVPRIFQRILAEATEVARAAGIEVEPYSRQFNFYRKLTAGGFLSTPLRGVFSLLVSALGYGNVRSSTLQSLERGRPTEIDWLNGYVADLGRKHGVATPTNRRIVEIVKEIERGGRRIGIENLGVLL